LCLSYLTLDPSPNDAACLSIRYSLLMCGHIKIVDRKRLQSAGCECYTTHRNGRALEGRKPLG
jgi:hypothetical protein